MKKITITILLTLLFKCVFAIDGVKKDKIETSKTDEISFSYNVFFDTNKYALNSKESNRLLEFIESTQNIDIKRITVVGFCDDRGSLDYNKKLSARRANTIRDLIVAYRNSDTDLEVLNADGRGEIELSVSKNKLVSSTRALNRKVTIIVTPKKKRLIAASFYGDDLRTGDLINLKSLKFKKGYRYLTPESLKYLDEVARFLVKRTDIYFTVNGHVCCTKGGGESRDQETGMRNLSTVRAKYIRNYLVKKGVKPQRVNYRGLKGKYNLGGNRSEDRRVEILIRYAKK